MPFTLPFNITGQPAISLPVHQTADGLPIGVQLVAAPGREDVLIRVAAQLEAAVPGPTGARRPTPEHRTARPRGRVGRRLGPRHVRAWSVPTG